jgi:hypothetical protein
MGTITTAFTAGATSGQAVPARPRKFLGIYNQSGSNTLDVAFDQPAVTVQTAGQMSIAAQGTPQTTFSWASWSGEGAVPSGAVNIIASGANTPVTIVEIL